MVKEKIAFSASNWGYVVVGLQQAKESNCLGFILYPPPSHLL